VVAVLAGALSLAWVAVAPGLAGATACGTAVAAGSTCTMTGTLTLSGGTLSLTSPSQLGWSGTLTGSNLSLYDTTAAEQTLSVNDATGSGAGWKVAVSATTFTTGSKTLANAGTFTINGSTSTSSASTAPTATCAGGTCTAPTDNTTYPVAVTTAASSPSQYTIYDTAASTGLGSFTISPVGWWLAVPASTVAGTYTSTVTMEVTSGP
jgi:hypothetical protein